MTFSNSIFACIFHLFAVWKSNLFGDISITRKSYEHHFNNQITLVKCMHFSSSDSTYDSDSDNSSELPILPVLIPNEQEDKNKQLSDCHCNCCNWYACIILFWYILLVSEIKVSIFMRNFVLKGSCFIYMGEV